MRSRSPFRAMPFRSSAPCSTVSGAGRTRDGANRSTPRTRSTASPTISSCPRLTTMMRDFSSCCAAPSPRRRRRSTSGSTIPRSEQTPRMCSGMWGTGVISLGVRTSCTSSTGTTYSSEPSRNASISITCSCSSSCCGCSVPEGCAGTSSCLSVRIASAGAGAGAGSGPGPTADAAVATSSGPAGAPFTSGSKRASDTGSSGTKVVSGTGGNAGAGSSCPFCSAACAAFARSAAFLRAAKISIPLPRKRILPQTRSPAEYTKEPCRQTLCPRDRLPIPSAAVPAISLVKPLLSPLFNDILDDLRRDGLGAPAIALEQGVAGDDVDAPRDALARRVERGERAGVEERLRPSGHGQPVGNILAGLLLVQWPQVELEADPLPEGPVRPLVQPSLQLGLADEHQGQEVTVVELEVRQQPELLEGLLARHKLRLVDDDRCPLSLFVQLIQPRVDPFEDAVLRVLLLLDAQPERHRLEKLGRRQPGIDDQHRVDT